MEESDMAVMGRPKSDNPKNRNVTIRLTEDKHREVMDFAARHDQTITKTLMDGFELLKKQEQST